MKGMTRRERSGGNSTGKAALLSEADVNRYAVLVENVRKLTLDLLASVQEMCYAVEEMSDALIVVAEAAPTAGAEQCEIPLDGDEGWWQSVLGQ